MSDGAIRKTIFIVRHGHAAIDALIDFDRPLDKKGIKQTTKTAQFIQQKCLELNITDATFISSSAFRTKQTSEIIGQLCQFNKFEFYRELYTASVSDWLDKIIAAKDENIIIVGHNPTFSQMLNNFCGHQIYMKPANCALINLEIMPDGIIYPARLIEFHNND